MPVTTVPSRHVSEERSGPLTRRWMFVVNWMENHRRQVFWVCLYTLVCLGIFAYKVYSYAVVTEHLGIRGATGYGVAVTRGSASGLMFTYSTLLVAMCRNIMTLLRETFVNDFLPIDNYINFHKLVALYALLFSLLHIVGHGFNFYHLNTQHPADISCVFPEFYQASTALPKFHYWLWSTITGVTGVLLTVLMAIIYIFATQYSRRHIFRAFRVTHSLYVVFFVLMILHGAGMLLQQPIFYYFLLGPAILFTLDKLISVSRNKTEISVFKAELWPSGVTALTFRKPVNFQYKSGQWVRIACLPLGENEYHPFTLTSAPHEDFLSVHVRAVGPWTHNLRHTYDSENLIGKPYPKLYLDGPYGEGHQDWYRFGVSVLIGGGIGVTPFASILKDVVYKSRMNMKIDCQKFDPFELSADYMLNGCLSDIRGQIIAILRKVNGETTELLLIGLPNDNTLEVYFIWVTQSQKHFEWLVDIIREVEDTDVNNMVSVHLFITQFYKKFDIRTTMLYICERHFQKISGRSLFTGLLSVTHFGRPDFETFLNTVRLEHNEVPKIGVFSCGPPSMTKFVMQACSKLNQARRDQVDPVFYHHSENF